MRYEAKSEREAVEAAAKALNRPAESITYTVIRDEKSFWGGRVVEIEIQEPAGGEQASAAARPTHVVYRDATDEESASAGQTSDDDEETWDARPPAPARAPRESRQNPAHEGGARREPAQPGATDADAVSAVESTLTELLSAAGLLVEIRRRESNGDELLFELFGDDVEPLLANKGEGLTGLEVLVGRIASKRIGAPVHPRLDAEGFRAHRKEALEELARNSAEEVRRSRRPQLLPPLAPWERRLVHIALAEEADVETESEGDGFMKRVEVRLKR
ncbi:MAG TPA: R3H domain-containing nucleic acid-binding protein [Thermoanaerobaculia bacterium]|jgi:spoIIIJ-associated protein|nr:R3H domain-containing nucleic acid-binding protein [Thermoanaerobaculia bacterium]